MSVLPSMGLETPTVGASRGTWGGTMNANIVKLDGHNHIDGNGEHIPIAGIDVDDDMSFGSQFGPIDLHALTFSSVTPLSTNEYNKSLFVSSADNQLYFRDRLGSNVKMTVDGALNVAAFTNGIGGNYASVSAALDFDDANKRYKHLDGADNWARGDFGGLKLFQIGTAETQGVVIEAPAALAASYTMTLPLALPVSTHPLQMTSTGIVVETGSIAMIANESITVSGTGDYKHGLKTKIIPVINVVAPGTTTSFVNFINTGVSLGISMRVGDRILAVRAIITDNVTGPTKVVVNLETALAGAAFAANATSTQSLGNATVQTLTVTAAAGGLSVVSGSVYGVILAPSTGSATCTLWSIEVDYDRP